MDLKFSEVFLLVSVLVLASMVFIFSTWYAPDIFSISEGSPQASDSYNYSIDAPARINITSQDPSNATNSGIITQSLTGLEALYNDAINGLLLLA